MSTELPTDARSQPDGVDSALNYEEGNAEDYEQLEQQSDDEEEGKDAELPEQGTTRGLLAKFQAMQTWKDPSKFCEKNVNVAIIKTA